MQEVMMTIKDVTQYLKLNRMTIYKMVRKKELPAVKIAGEWRFRKESIDKWVAGKSRMPSEAKEGEINKKEGNILVVDDEKDICDFFSYLLEQEGYKINIATNGRTALKLIDENRPVLILLDLKMPGMSGLEVLEELRKTGNTTPVIALSEYAEMELNIKATRLGIHNCIIKPFDLEKTKRAIEEAIEKP